MAYHHGHLRQALLDAAIEAIEATGPGTLSLRDLARRAGVSHAAPAHHFGDRAGLLTAVAIDGYRLLTDALTASGGQLLDLGMAYVRFAVTRRGYFDVMFRPDLYHADDPELVAAGNRAAEMLGGGVAGLSDAARRDPDLTRLAAWSLVHGFATLWNSGAIDHDGTTADELAGRVAASLFPPDDMPGSAPAG